MKTQRTIFAVIMILTMLMTNVSTVHALPPLPSTIYGTVKVDGVNVPLGTAVTAWVNGVEYASTLTTEYLSDSVYSVDVPGDDPATAGILEGGIEGDTIVFHIGDLVAVETGVWHTGVPATVNISNPGYTLTVGSDHGTVTKSPNDTFYHIGEDVSLTAVPDAGWTFANWTGDLTGTDNPGSVAIIGNTNVTANYTQGSFTLSVNKTGSGSGTVTSTPAGIDCGATCAASFSNGTSVTLTASVPAGSFFSGWSGSGCSGNGTCIVMMDASKSVSADFGVTQAPSGVTCTNLTPVPATTSTGEKPQSKVWNYNGAWYAVFPTNTSGASSAGTWVWKLVGTTWTEVIKISDRADTKADALVDGTVVHLLLWRDSNTQLSSIEYVGGTYQLWATRNSLVNISLPGSEIGTIAIDSTDMMWLSTRNSSGEIIVYNSSSPYSSWGTPYVLETGVIADDDLSVITALPNGTIGVFWGNENASVRRFGFRYHVDGDASNAWSANEVPASQSAIDGVGTGMADDHMNFAVASDGTLYVAIKTSYDTSGYTKMALLVRRPNGTWDNIYPIDESGTRPIVLLDEVHGVLTFIYTSSEGYNPIVYRQTSTADIAFDARKTLRSSSFNDVSSMKANYNSSFVVIYSSSSEVAGQYCTANDATGADLSITKSDGLVSVQPNDPITYTIQASNVGPEAVVGATITDTMPSELTNVSWTCTAAGGGSCPTSGSGNINSNVNLPVSASVTFTVGATVSMSASGDIVNTVSIAPPAGVVDPVLTNNSASDTDTVSISITPCENDPTLVGCWQMEENGGSVLLDGSSYANHGALFGSPLWAAGMVGSYALDLDGSTQYAIVPDDTSLDIANQLTLTAWIKPERYETQDIVKKATKTNVDGYELTLATTKTDDSSQKVFFRINDATNGDSYRINASTDYPIDGTWIHAAGTFDGTTLRLYINGILDSSLVLPPGTTIALNDLPVSIGAQNDAQRFYQGWMDDVRIYNRALSLQEIQILAGLTTTHTISGNAGVAGATVSFTGGTPVTASGTGAYSITVPYNWTGTVTPSLAGYTFAPVNRDYTNVMTDQVNQDFTATDISYTISGNAGVAGATVSFTGGTPVTASGTGAYSITVPYNWTGTVTPSLAGYTFAPVSRDYTNVLANQTAQNYTATAITFTISGNAGVAGATVSFTGGTPVTASGTGAYSITVPYNWTGTVTPSLAGYTFAPVSRDYTNVLANQTAQNYTATAITFTISGNAGVAGATVSFTGGTPVTASGTGAYSITVPYNWTGTVTPSLAGYTFAPVSRDYTNVLANQTAQNYTATAITFTISGNAGVAGATVSFTGGTPVTASGTGAYSITVPYNWTGTVTPSLAGYTFAPVNRDYTNVMTDQVNQDFTATDISYTISGNAGVAGATVSFTGGTPVTASGTGAYSITVPYNWTGTVTPSLAGYTFAPVNRDYTNVMTDQVNQDFTATDISYTISGNAGVAGATVSFTGGTPVTASGTGAYSITVPYNWTGTVTPSLAGYTFAPVSRDYTNVLANQTAQNYTATHIPYILTVIKTGTGSGTVTSVPTGINCGSTCSNTFEFNSLVTLTAAPLSNYHRFVGWSGAGCSGTGTCDVTMDAAKTVTAEFEQSTFGDVPFDHPLWAYVETLYDNGFTSGCQATGDPLMFCPEATMLRAESAVFMLRGQAGASYIPPVAPWDTFFDNWVSIEWAEKWAEGMWEEGLTAGCQYPADSPEKLFCPFDLFTREQGAVFGLRMKYGTAYVPPPATGTVFSDMTDAAYWSTKWVEQAYADELLLSCGMDNGKPTICPTDELSRSWAAYMIVKAKGLSLSQ